ncbi:MAG: hypothetical protein ACI9XU_000452 [Arenicella sp.]|jgi:hypothetical protein
MIVTAGSTKVLNQTRSPYLACLFLTLGLTACSDSEPTKTATPIPTRTVQPASQQGELGASLGLHLEVDQLGDNESKPAVVTEGLIKSPNLDASPASTELDRSILKLLSKLSQTHGLSIEANSVRELEQLSEADRQTLQELAAQQTMTAAEQLAAKQVANATKKVSN